MYNSLPNSSLYGKHSTWKVLVVQERHNSQLWALTTIHLHTQCVQEIFTPSLFEQNWASFFSQKLAGRISLICLNRYLTNFVFQFRNFVSNYLKNNFSFWRNAKNTWTKKRWRKQHLKPQDNFFIFVKRRNMSKTEMKYGQGGKKLHNSISLY